MEVRTARPIVQLLFSPVRLAPALILSMIYISISLPCRSRPAHPAKPPGTLFRDPASCDPKEGALSHSHSSTQPFAKGRRGCKCCKVDDLTTFYRNKEQEEPNIRKDLMRDGKQVYFNVQSRDEDQEEQGRIVPVDVKVGSARTSDGTLLTPCRSNPGRSTMRSHKI